MNMYPKSPDGGDHAKRMASPESIASTVSLPSKQGKDGAGSSRRGEGSPGGCELDKAAPLGGVMVTKEVERDVQMR